MIELSDAAPAVPHAEAEVGTRRAACVVPLVDDGAGAAVPAVDTAPAAHAFAISPDDDNPLPHVTRAIYVGGAGDVACILLQSGGDFVVFRGLPAGAILPVRAWRVNSDETTATNLVGLY